MQHFTKINDFLHYSEVSPGSSGERTIYGKKESGLEYVYSDRLVQWDYDKHNQAWDKVKAPKHTYEFYQEYLCEYYNEQILLKHIIIGVNIHTGYDYKIFGFIRKG
jgi:hypothetical protein